MSSEELTLRGAFSVLGGVSWLVCLGLAQGLIHFGEYCRQRSEKFTETSYFLNEFLATAGRIVCLSAFVVDERR